MNVKKIILWVVLIGVVIYLFSSYNGLVSKEEGVQASWAQVENQYQRRMDLIPNLVNTVRGAADFERETLTAVIQARSQATSIQFSSQDLSNTAKFQQFEKAQQGVSSALSRLLVSVERYPQLSATKNFRDLQAQLEGTENRISVERKRFNEIVQKYNTSVRRFPTSIIASITGFERKSFFSAESGAQNAPAVSF